MIGDMIISQASINPFSIMISIFISSGERPAVDSARSDDIHQPIVGW
jgi:hypothetical protein